MNNDQFEGNRIGHYLFNNTISIATLDRVFNYIPVTALNQLLINANGPPAWYMALARQARTHNPIKLVNPMKLRTTILSKTISDASDAGLLSCTLLFVFSATIVLSLMLSPPEDEILTSEV